MMTKTKTLSLLFCLSAFAVFGQNSYRVEVARFLERVDIPTYFEGLEDVSVYQDHNAIYRYTMGDFADKTTADEKAKIAKDKGFKYARVIDLAAQREACVCAAAPAALFLESIFFDFDRSDLRAVSQSQLDRMTTILQENPSYKAKLVGHTDAKGSNEYNQALSRRRANAAKNYLIDKGIPESRIIIDYSGEAKPIAKNELNGGIDTPQGRQYNRRVELQVLDANGQVVGAVKKIDVPSELEN